MQSHRLNGERRLFTAEQVRALDACAIESHGIPGATLMRRAARSAFAVLTERWPDAARIAVFCGGGNNGGDGYLIAALAQQAGMATQCFWLSDPEKLSGDAAGAWHACVESGVTPQPWRNSSGGLSEVDVCVDAMLGTGLDRDVEGQYAKAIAEINNAGSAVLAVDIPSGLNADTGAVMGCAVESDVTCSFIGLKRGLFTGRGPACCGAVHFADLDVPAAVLESEQAAVRLLDETDLAAWLPSRPRDAHKGDHGHVLAIGGDQGMSGAIRMAAEAALRSGAGLVSVATREAHAAAITQQRPELMCRGVEDQAALESMLDRASVVLVGPGLGQDDWGRTVLARALDCGKPMVIDADALNLLAEQQLRPPPGAVMTPHPGEAARLLGTTSADIQADRFAAAMALQELYGVTVALKGTGTLVADTRRMMLCPYGNPGMAVGGMGDVLSGVMASMLGQGMSSYEAACCAVLVHALAGDQAAQSGGERGLLPSDLYGPIRERVNPVRTSYVTDARPRQSAEP